MNERIKELMEYAVRFRLDPDSNAYEAQVTPEDLKLFAELIVRKCISTIENAENGYQDYRNQIEDGMRNHCISLIKNEFGVEE